MSWACQRHSERVVESCIIYTLRPVFPFHSCKILIVNDPAVRLALHCTTRSTELMACAALPSARFERRLDADPDRTEITKHHERLGLQLVALSTPHAPACMRLRWTGCAKSETYLLLDDVVVTALVTRDCNCDLAYVQSVARRMGVTFKYFNSGRRTCTRSAHYGKVSAKPSYIVGLNGMQFGYENTKENKRYLHFQAMTLAHTTVLFHEMDPCLFVMLLWRPGRRHRCTVPFLPTVILFFAMGASRAARFCWQRHQSHAFHERRPRLAPTQPVDVALSMFLSLSEDVCAAELYDEADVYGTL